VSPYFPFVTMSTQRAIIHKTAGVLELGDDAPIPGPLEDDWILIKTKAVALNPADWQEIEEAPSPGSIAGCDYAGVVEAVGKNLTQYKVGDRVLSW
jgi:NADPH:quinone reductase-like Zn-dependent oxidoreductase